MRMRVERGEICWSDIDSEAKSQTSPSFVPWATKLMMDTSHFDAIISVGIGKALNLSKTRVINRSPLDLEFLISRWSIESHTFVAAWGGFGRTLEDVVVLTGLPIFRESRAIAMPEDLDVKLDEEGEIKGLVCLTRHSLTRSTKERARTTHGLTTSYRARGNE